MNNLIYRQAAIDEVQYEIEMINNTLDSLTLDYNTRERLCQRKVEAREILNSIETLPAIDAVPVVRCRNCKYVSKERSPESARKFGQLYDCGLGVLGSPKADDFCSYGERREEDRTIS